MFMIYPKIIWNNAINPLLSQVSLHDYSQIQIVDAVTGQEDDGEVGREKTMWQNRAQHRGVVWSQ